MIRGGRKSRAKLRKQTRRVKRISRRKNSHRLRRGKRQITRKSFRGHKKKKTRRRVKTPLVGGAGGEDDTPIKTLNINDDSTTSEVFRSLISCLGLLGVNPDGRIVACHFVSAKGLVGETFTDSMFGKSSMDEFVDSYKHIGATQLAVFLPSNHQGRVPPNVQQNVDNFTVAYVNAYGEDALPITQIVGSGRLDLGQCTQLLVDNNIIS
jgi:hypothetical protein